MLGTDSQPFSPPVPFIWMILTPNMHTQCISSAYACCLLLPDGNGKPKQAGPVTAGWWRERAQLGEGAQSGTGGDKNRGGTQGLIKELFNLVEHSFGAASHSYPGSPFPRL